MIFSITKNNKGYSIIPTVATMIVLGLLSISATSITGMGEQASSDNMQSIQALSVGNGGIEYAIGIIDQGLNPDGEVMDLNPGIFSIATDPSSSLITVSSEVGKAKRIQNVTANFSKDCVDEIVTEAIVTDNNITGLKLKKNCNSLAILNAISISWNLSECSKSISCDDDLSTIAEPQNGKSLICHVPPGNPENAHTLSVSPAGWNNGHKAGTGPHHDMDYLGPCDGDKESLTTCEANSSQIQALSECPVETDSLTISRIDINDTTVFLSGSIPDYSATNLAAGDEVNINDFLLSENTEYTVDIYFSSDLPQRTWYEINFGFADDTLISKTARVGTLPPGAITQATGFTLANGVVTLDGKTNMQIDVLGSEISCGTGGSAIDVMADLCTHNSCDALWSGSDVNGGETYAFLNKGSQKDYFLQATGQLALCNNFLVTYDSTNTSQVLALKNGDTLPESINEAPADYLLQYLDNDHNAFIENNQLLFIFELQSDLTEGFLDSTDFQDLAILITIT